MIIKYKKSQYREQFLKRDVILKLICLDFASFSVRSFGITPVMTRVTDSVTVESGVHPQGRAVDFRDETSDGKRLYSDFQVETLVNFLNARYSRRGFYPTIYHHGELKHFHIQTPPLIEDYTHPNVIQAMAEGFILAEQNFYQSSPLVCTECTSKLELYKRTF